jgi:hypothetical protein
LPVLCFADVPFESQPLPVRLIRNIMNRFWGGAAAPAEDTSEDEDNVDRPLDDGGVD